MARYLVTFLPGNPIPTRTKYVDDASGPPDADVDAGTDGVSFGSILWDGTDLWFCVDAMTAAAQWVQISGGGGDTSLDIDLTVTGSYTIDRAVAATHDLILTGTTTFTLDGAVTGKRTDWSLIIHPDGETYSFTDTIAWIGGVVPAGGGSDVEHVAIWTVDDGATYYGAFLAAGSNIDPATTVESETTFGLSPAVGTDLEYARQDHTHGTPADPVSATAVEALGRWEPVQFDDGSSPWPFVYFGDEIVVAWVPA